MVECVGVIVPVEDGIGVILGIGVWVEVGVGVIDAVADAGPSVNVREGVVVAVKAADITSHV
jgi:hypothetical protein